MLSLLRHCIRVSTACVLVMVFSVPQNLMAQAHVVSPSELQKATAASTQARERNIETVRKFLRRRQPNRRCGLRICSQSRCARVWRV